MEMNGIKSLVEARGMVYNGAFLNSLSEEDFNTGMIKVNLQEIENLDSLNGEGCWAWISKEDRKIYDRNSKDNVVKVILANSPFEYMGILFWGSELEVQCNGNNRPTLSKKWVTEKILNANWYNSSSSYKSE